MRKHFKGKHRLNKGFLLWGLIIIISLILNNNLLKETSKSFLIENNVKNLNLIKFDKDKILLFLGLNYKEKEKENVPVFNEVEMPKPKIYLYNTHQTEAYADGDILEASKILKESLESANIEVIWQQENIATILKERNLKYKDSYKITREFMEKVMSDEFAMYIDLHRDSSSKKVTTATIDGKNYAKVMFVIGAKHVTYKENYQLADNLNKLFKNFNNSITRGIYVRKSSSYNQDLSSNTILIELGGPYNTMEEIKNTISVITDIILYYVGE